MFRLGAAEREELMAAGGEPLAPRGRVMREYVVVPERFHVDEEFMRRWAERAVAFAGALPPKAAGPRRVKRTA